MKLTILILLLDEYDLQQLYSRLIIAFTTHNDIQRARRAPPKVAPLLVSLSQIAILVIFIIIWFAFIIIIAIIHKLWKLWSATPGGRFGPYVF